MDVVRAVHLQSYRGAGCSGDGTRSTQDRRTRRRDRHPSRGILLHCGDCSRNLDCCRLVLHVSITRFTFASREYANLFSRPVVLNLLLRSMTMTFENSRSILALFALVIVASTGYDIAVERRLITESDRKGIPPENGVWKFNVDETAIMCGFMLEHRSYTERAPRLNIHGQTVSLILN